jgi:uncharacterized protein YndB with AHSA1/START domain
MEPTISDAAVLKATGKTWDAWFKLIDKAGGRKLDHKQIVAWLDESHSVKPWWIQMVTVAYEQSRGLRALHQKPGGFEFSVSKTINVPIEALFEAFADDKQRAKWLGDELSVRKATKPKSARFDFKGGTLVSANFYAKGKGKSYVGLNHGKLKDAKAAAKLKKFWAQKLARLKDLLEKQS